MKISIVVEHPARSKDAGASGHAVGRDFLADLGSMLWASQRILPRAQPGKERPRAGARRIGTRLIAVEPQSLECGLNRRVAHAKTTPLAVQ